MTDPVELARSLAPCGYCRGRGKSYLFTSVENECHVCKGFGAAPWATERARAFAAQVRREERERCASIADEHERDWEREKARPGIAPATYDACVAMAAACRSVARYIRLEPHAERSLPDPE